LGEHTDEILASLGYSEAEIHDLRKAGITAAKGLLSSQWVKKIVLKIVGE